MAIVQAFFGSYPIANTGQTPPGGSVIGTWGTLGTSITYTAGTNNRGLTKGDVGTWTSALGDANTVKTSGKWYYEVNIIGGPSLVIGFGNTATPTGNFAGSSTASTGIQASGVVTNPNVSTGSNYTTGDTVGVALDIDGKTVTFYKKVGAAMVMMGSPINWSANVVGTSFQPVMSMNLNTQILVNFGQSAFTAVPSGYNPGFYV